MRSELAFTRSRGLPDPRKSPARGRRQKLADQRRIVLRRGSQSAALNSTFLEEERTISIAIGIVVPVR
jgi:hypothetical protein